MREPDASESSSMQPGIEPTVAPQVLAALVAAVEATGVSREQFLRAIGRSGQDLWTQSERLPLSEVLTACGLALELSGEPALGLRWAQGLSVREFSPVSHLLAHTPSLRHGLTLLAKFEPLFCDRRLYEVIEHSDTVTIRMSSWHFDTPVLERFASEMLLAAMTKVVSLYVPRTPPRVVRLRYGAPAHLAEYERVFGGRLRFGQATTEVVFDRRLLDQPSPHADHDLQLALSSIAEQRLDRVAQASPPSERVRDQLSARLPYRSTMDDVAKALRTSPRSLRRQLTREGTSFREIEHQVLRATAVRLLRERGLTIQAIAHELDFADAATFHRAFKGWTGQTPSEFRAQVLRADGPRSGKDPTEG